MKKLDEIKKVLLSYPYMQVEDINESEVHTVWGVAYTTADRINEIKDKIGARSFYVTWTPFKISEGIVIVFEL